jgi:hypothetical protein
VNGGSVPITYVTVARLEIVVPEDVPTAQLICGAISNKQAHKVMLQVRELSFVKPEKRMNSLFTKLKFANKIPE